MLWVKSKANTHTHGYTTLRICVCVMLSGQLFCKIYNPITYIYYIRTIPIYMYACSADLPPRESPYFRRHKPRLHCRGLLCYYTRALPGDARGASIKLITSGIY